MDSRANEILEFWETVGPKGWYEVSEELDETIREKYLSLWEEASAGKYKDWNLNAREALALIILMDQFPRNMFRGDGKSFATDEAALCVAKRAIEHDLDQQIDGNMRQFFYLPLMHSESVVDQDASVRAFVTRMPGTDNLRHAKAHRKVIREFGRFPYRNDALGRKSTEEEVDYIKAGGYRHTLETLAA